MTGRKSLTSDYFDEVYRAASDPWGFQTSAYEAAKYAATLAALPRKFYESTWEIGCSIGVLTEKLAVRCGRLLAVDISEIALTQAAERCRNLPQVEIKKMRFPAEFPAETFDLILISEVAYYLSPDDWKQAQKLLVEHLKPNGNIVLVHWTPPVHDYPQTGDEVHDSFLAETARNLRHLTGKREEKYRLDVFEKI